MFDGAGFARRGFVVISGFLDADTAAALLGAAIDLARQDASGVSVAPAFVTPEANLAGTAFPAPEDAVSKVFRIHRIRPFHDFVVRPEVVELVASALGAEDVDCFGSQFIFKNPGAWGQPCHQDARYFPFDPPRPVVGVWLATTAATRDNGCLWVVPGSHVEPVHDHVPDRRPNANLGYLEIVDRDLSDAECVEMEVGDLLLFDSHLMHYSSDNRSSQRRAAMVCHYAPTGTSDRSLDEFGYTIHDWLTVRRSPVPAASPS